MTTFTPGMIIEPGVVIQSNTYGESLYTTAGTYSWTAPDGVTSVCAVCIGGGGGGLASDLSGSFYAGRGGGAGGGLGWKNNISVVPGQTYAVVVGSGGNSLTVASSNLSTQSPSGTSSYFIDLSTVAGLGGSGARAQGSSALGGSFVGDGGGVGGNSGQRAVFDRGGAGGAGGYTGNGGIGGAFGFAANSAPSGGGGGGAGSPSNSLGAVSISGGGVGVFGQGASGSGGLANTGNGGGGSGGQNGQAANGGNYGGGSGGLTTNDRGGGGAVRIIWGQNRAFPSTNVGPS